MSNRHNSKSGSLLRVIVFGVAALLLLNSCMVGPKYVRPAAPSSRAFKEKPPTGWQEAWPNDEAPRGKWWTVFRDSQLNALVEQVSISNQNVLAAEARFREAQATVRSARAA